MALRDNNKAPKAAQAPATGGLEQQQRSAPDDLAFDDDPELDTGFGEHDASYGGSEASIEDSGEDESPTMHRVEVLTHGAIINGHHMRHVYGETQDQPPVVEMSMKDILVHRRQGVAISDPLSDEEMNEKGRNEPDVDISKPFQPKQLDDKGRPAAEPMDDENTDLNY